MSKTRNRLTTVGGAGAVVVLSVAGAAYAASLTVNSSDLAAGRDDVGTCQSGAIDTSWVPNVDVTNTGTGWNVNSVLLTGVSNACQGKTVYVTLVNGSTVVGSGSVPVPTASATTPFRVTVTGTPSPLPVANVTKVDVLIPS